MIYSKSNKFEPLLEAFVVRDNKDLLRFRKLSEEEKAEMSKELVESLYRHTAEKAMSLDYDDVSQSEGDITRIKDYQVLVDSLALLNAMQVNMRERIEDLDTLNNAHKNLLDGKANFEQGFKVGSTPVMLVYNNVALALVASTSFVIATALDYVKDPVGNYNAHYRANVGKHKGYPTIFLDSLRKFNLLAVSGDLHKLFELSYSKQAFVGSMAISGGAVAALVAIGLAFTIVPMLREMVYQYFHMRVSLADYLRLQASFVEMNRSKLLTAGSSRAKSVAKRQEDLMKKMVSLADKVDVDQKQATKKAEMEISRENTTATMDEPQIAQNSAPSESLL